MSEAADVGASAGGASDGGANDRFLVEICYCPNQMNGEESNPSTKPRRGGARPGAGRKRTGRSLDAPHRQRPELSPDHPVHVVLRIARNAPELRRRDIYHAVRGVLARYLERPDFRVVHVSIQNTHIHLLVEAADRRALTRGMQSLAINTARAFHATGDPRRRGCGKVFAHRYHATQIRTPFHARHALAYVLNNWRRHQQDFINGTMREARLDPYASGLAFDGWTREWRFDVPAGYLPLPVSPPATALLSSRWKQCGLVDPWERPGPLALR